jgi:hypothetical protein
VAARLATLSPWAEVDWTKAGGGVAVGVIAFDGAEAGPVPAALVAATVNV